MKTIIFENECNKVTFKIGKNSKENWELLNENKNYIWFHLSAFPSCYVICCFENPTDEMIQFGAELCKENTKYRNLKNLKVSYTPISNLEKGIKKEWFILKVIEKLNQLKFEY